MAAGKDTVSAGEQATQTKNVASPTKPAAEVAKAEGQHPSKDEEEQWVIIDTEIDDALADYNSSDAPFDLSFSYELIALEDADSSTEPGLEGQTIYDGVIYSEGVVEDEASS